MPVYLAWQVMCALALVLPTCCGKRTQPKGPQPLQMFEQAAEAKGTDYFLLKRRIMAVKNARDVILKLLEERRLAWQERLVARAVLDELERPEHCEEERRRLGLLLLRVIDLPKPSASAEDEKGSSSGGPEALPENPELSEALKSLAGEVGFLAEIVLKHTADTIAELVAKARADEQKMLHREWAERRKERSENPNAAIGLEPELFTAEALLGTWSQSDRRRYLGPARSIAAQALALTGTEESERLIEEMARVEGDVAEQAPFEPGRTSACLSCCSC